MLVAREVRISAMDDIKPADAPEQLTQPQAVNSDPSIPPTTEVSNANTPAPTVLPAEPAQGTGQLQPSSDTAMTADMGQPMQNDQPTSGMPAANNPVEPKRSVMPLVLILVFLVVLGLAAVAYFAFVKNGTVSKSSTTYSTSSTTTSATTSTTIATETDPSKVSDSIDAALSKIDDNKDFDSSTISDATLNL